MKLKFFRLLAIAIISIALNIFSVDPNFAQPTGSVNVINIGINWADDAQTLIMPKNDNNNNFQRYISDPHLTQLLVDGVPYVYLATRIRVGQNANEIRLARIKAEKFSVNGKIASIDEWNFIPRDSFLITDKNNLTVTGPSIVGINGKLLISYKLKGKSEHYFLILFDPLKNKVLWNKDIKSIEGYGGPTTKTLFSLSRVTKGRPGQDDDYFNSYKGDSIISYTCRKSNEGVCKNIKNLDYAFIQKINLNNKDVLSFGLPIKIYTDEVNNENDHAIKKGQLWKKQNLKVSAMGNDEIILSLNYNIVDDSNKHARDYPCCGSFFKIDHVSELLNPSYRESNIDIPGKINKDNAWKIGIRTGNSWDQGALWGIQFYNNPFDKKIFGIYESWGSSKKQNLKVSQSFYPGQVSEYIKIGSESESLSCVNFCQKRRFFGGGCLSASLVTPNNSGIEMDHFKTLSAYRKVDSSVYGAWYVCSEIGSSGSAEDIKQILVSKAEAEKYNDIDVMGESICKDRGQNGFIRAEAITGPGSGKVVFKGEEKIKNTSYSIMCSKDYKTTDFKEIIISGHGSVDRNCNDVCEGEGANKKIGMRSYYSEPVFMLTNDKLAKEIGGVGVDSYFSLGRYFFDAGSSERKNYNQSGQYKLKCVCGPGQDSSAIMAYRVVKDFLY